MCIYICIYTRSFKDPKNYRSSKKPCFFKKNRVFVKNPYFGFCWICTNLSKSGGPVSNFSSLRVAISYWQLVKSVRQNARWKPKQALSDTMRAFSTGCSCLLCCELSLQRDWRQSKSHNGYAWHFKSQLSGYEPSKLTIAPVICVVFFLSRSGSYRFDLAKPQAEP